MNCTLVSRPNYRRYNFTNSLRQICRIVLENYNGVWNLDLMHAVPPGQGIGSSCLQSVLQDMGLNPKNMTVHAIDRESRHFFHRHGFVV